MVTPSVFFTSMSWALATKGNNIIANKNSCFFIIVICFNSNLFAKVIKIFGNKKENVSNYFAHHAGTEITGSVLLIIF